jgi:hypothetical protein
MSLPMGQAQYSCNVQQRPLTTASQLVDQPGPDEVLALVDLVNSPTR